MEDFEGTNYSLLLFTQVTNYLALFTKKKEGLMRKSYPSVRQSCDTLSVTKMFGLLVTQLSIEILYNNSQANVSFVKSGALTTIRCIGT